MSIQDSETKLAEAAALAKPASVIYDKFINNAVGDPQIVTRAGVIPSLSDIIKSLQNSAGGGASKVYPSVSEGIAGTKDKEIFVVGNGNPYVTKSAYILVQNNNGSSLTVGYISIQNYSVEEKTKLSNIAENATSNSTDAQLRDRATHTGTQAISTVTNLSDTLTNLSNGLASTNTVVNANTADLTKLKQSLLTAATNTLLPNYHYTLASTVTAVTLPSAASSVAGDVVFLSKTIAATVVVNSGGVLIVTETKGADTQVNYNLNIPLKFTFNGTNWELEGI